MTAARTVHVAAGRRLVNRKAAQLLTEASTDPRSQLLASVSGPGGSGKSTLLENLAVVYSEAGIPVRTGRQVLQQGAVDEGTTVLIDDAHQWDDPELERIHRLVDGQPVNVVVAYRMWPQLPALNRLTTTLETHRRPVLLGPWNRDEVAAHTATTHGEPLPGSVVDRIFELTGGMPWLVQHALEAMSSRGRTLPQDPLEFGGLVDQVGYELERLAPDLRELLLALAVGFDPAGPMPAEVEDTLGGIDPLMSQAAAAGLILPEGSLPPLMRSVLLQTTPLHHVRTAQHALAGLLSTGETPDPTDVARGLAQSGLQDPRVASTLQSAGDSALATEPHLAATLYEEATAAGAPGVSTAARRAQAALATGDLEGAGRLVDPLLSQPEAPDKQRGADVAASLWAQRGMLARSAQVYRWVGAPAADASKALAAVVMIGTGDRDAARSLLAADRLEESPTLTNVAVSLMGQGVAESVGEHTERALPALVRASDMLTASGAAIPLPDSPAALAALVALHSGELSVAESVLDDALRGGQGGPAGRLRLLLLRAWVAMLQDHPDNAGAAIAEATAGGTCPAPRDELLLDALHVGLARRTDDMAGLVRAWERARGRLLHVAVDLYNLLPLGELAVAAARLRDSERLRPHLADAWALLDKLDQPALWSTPLRWYAVQAAILAEKPTELAPQASALVRASGKHHLAAVLASAGRSWVSVLAGRIEPRAVEESARALAAVGLTWDGARLAGHAAAHAEERKDMSRLLACARDLHPGTRGATTTEPNHPAQSTAAEHEPRMTVTTGKASAPEGPALSEREREVARLVLEGKTYREIGAAIFISPRTAEHHIARIRRRLGASNRSELLTQLRLALGEDGSQGP
ncbi:LuxR C-terminal-related transcriptional regulator [Arthrobacter sulfonylureivorans]|uniref:LuxR C-terminal-related transcriptional regulator n=1 Tax=Arthrobacter sulfonylureivorans TaxID=2486855 RepID=A0ABY3WF37_9MICC|nr:LuxR C-terminal-related transcriptional regulator [Arthrobacter sulfonylureivorans]UNK46309.1 LuxR C-terminal-related transcriptional regulator [Arthrobacter sulfonylureivorans]